jgi:hypothetical protein
MRLVVALQQALVELPSVGALSKAQGVAAYPGRG